MPTIEESHDTKLRKAQVAADLAREAMNKRNAPESACLMAEAVAVGTVCEVEYKKGF